MILSWGGHAVRAQRNGGISRHSRSADASIPKDICQEVDPERYGDTALLRDDERILPHTLSWQRLLGPLAAVGKRRHAAQ